MFDFSSLPWKNVSEKIPAHKSICVLKTGDLAVRTGRVNSWRWSSLISGEEFPFESSPEWILASVFKRKTAKGVQS